MELPPHKLNVGRDEDQISALTDDLLIGILERLDLRDAVRAGALSTRWRDLPYRQSRLHLDAGHFQGATPLEVMDAFTGAVQRLLSVVVPLAEGECDSAAIIPIKALMLSFYMSSPHLSAIGRTVEDVVSYGKTECLEFCISLPPASNASLLAEFGQQFMSFSQAYLVAFCWLTRLRLKNLVFGHFDITELINAYRTHLRPQAQDSDVLFSALREPSSVLRRRSKASPSDPRLLWKGVASASHAERVPSKEFQESVETETQFFFPNDLDSAGAPEAAHCYIPKPGQCVSFWYLP